MPLHTVEPVTENWLNAFQLRKSFYDIMKDFHLLW